MYNKILILFITSYLSLKAVSFSPEVFVGQHEIVVAGHSEAAEAGLKILHEGGNAIDASVAVSLSLGVAEPYASGLGGKIEILYYNSKDKTVSVIDGMDMASRTLPVEEFIHLSKHKRIEEGASAAIPGLARGLFLAHQKWGRLSWSKDVEPSWILAESGTKVYAKTVQLMNESFSRFRNNQEANKLFLINGKMPAIGSRLKNLDLANTLRMLGAKGADFIYTGDTAEAIVSCIVKAGGYMTLNDLSSYSAKLLEPISIPFKSGRLYSTSPVSGGGVLLGTIASLDKRLNTSSLFRSAENLDKFGKMFEIQHAKFESATGDDNEVNTRFKELLADKINVNNSFNLTDLADVEVNDYDSKQQSTTHFIVVDRDRNIACVTQSLSYHYGCGIIITGTGIIMNNSLSNFSVTAQGKPNYVTPGKRPKSTIAPSIWLDKYNQPKLAIGLPGGARITTGLAQVILDYGEFNRSLSESIADVRVHILTSPKKSILESESGMNETLIRDLKKIGWDVKVVEQLGTGEQFGGVNAVEFMPNGCLRGVADLRRTNAVRGE